MIVNNEQVTIFHQQYCMIVKNKVKNTFMGGGEKQS